MSTENIKKQNILSSEQLTADIIDIQSVCLEIEKINDRYLTKDDEIMCRLMKIIESSFRFTPEHFNDITQEERKIYAEKIAIYIKQCIQDYSHFLLEKYSRENNRVLKFLTNHDYSNFLLNKIHIEVLKHLNLCYERYKYRQKKEQQKEAGLNSLMRSFGVAIGITLGAGGGNLLWLTTQSNSYNPQAVLDSADLPSQSNLPITTNIPSKDTTEPLPKSISHESLAEKYNVSDPILQGILNGRHTVKGSLKGLGAEIANPFIRYINTHFNGQIRTEKLAKIRELQQKINRGAEASYAKRFAHVSSKNQLKDEQERRLFKALEKRRWINRNTENVYRPTGFKWSVDEAEKYFREHYEAEFIKYGWSKEKDIHKGFAPGMQIATFQNGKYHDYILELMKIAEIKGTNEPEKQEKTGSLDYNNNIQEPIELPDGSYDINLDDLEEKHAALDDEIHIDTSDFENLKQVQTHTNSQINDELAEIDAQWS